jgi:hypothetical protein
MAPEPVQKAKRALKRHLTSAEGLEEAMKNIANDPSIINSPEMQNVFEKLQKITEGSEENLQVMLDEAPDTGGAGDTSDVEKVNETIRVRKEAFDAQAERDRCKGEKEKMEKGKNNAEAGKINEEKRGLDAEKEKADAEKKEKEQAGKLSEKEKQLEGAKRVQHLLRTKLVAEKATSKRGRVTFQDDRARAEASQATQAAILAGGNGNPEAKGNGKGGAGNTVGGNVTDGAGSTTDVGKKKKKKRKMRGARKNKSDSSSQSENSLDDVAPEVAWAKKQMGNATKYREGAVFSDWLIQQRDVKKIPAKALIIGADDKILHGPTVSDYNDAWKAQKKAMEDDGTLWNAVTMKIQCDKSLERTIAVHTKDVESPGVAEAEMKNLKQLDKTDADYWREFKKLAKQSKVAESACATVFIDNSRQELKRICGTRGVKTLAEIPDSVEAATFIQENPETAMTALGKNNGDAGEDAINHTGDHNGDTGEGNTNKGDNGGFVGECFRCGKFGHRSFECRSAPKNTPKGTSFGEHNKNNGCKGEGNGHKGVSPFNKGWSNNGVQIQPDAGWTTNPVPNPNYISNTLEMLQNQQQLALQNGQQQSYQQQQ